RGHLVEREEPLELCAENVDRRIHGRVSLHGERAADGTQAPGADLHVTRPDCACFSLSDASQPVVVEPHESASTRGGRKGGRDIVRSERGMKTASRSAGARPKLAVVVTSALFVASCAASEQAMAPPPAAPPPPPALPPTAPPPVAVAPAPAVPA